MPSPPRHGARRGLTAHPDSIERLAADAYTWGLAPEFVYRFQKYNNLVTAPRNTLGGGGGGAAAAWNNNATSAGDASVLYLNAMLDLSGERGRGGTKELVLTVPPSKSDYYVLNLLDAFINSIGSIGTRTTPNLIRKVVDSTRLPATVKTQLIASLQSVVAGFDPNNPLQRKIACLRLKAFTSVIRYVAPPAVAAEWTADANRIRAVLGC